MPHRTQRTEIESQMLTLDGGINYLDPSQVRPNEHVAGRNWFMDRDGVVRPRPGNTRWNPTALGADVLGFWEYRRQADGVNRLIALTGGTLWRGTDSPPVFTVLVTGLSLVARGYAMNAIDKCWWCNGVDTPRVYDDTNLFRIGIVAPSAAPAVTRVALAGNLPAEAHYYRYTYVREVAGVAERESNPSPESAAVTNDAANAQNDVTVTASPDPQVTHIYIRRRSATSVPEDKLVAKVANSTQTYRDNLAPSALGAFGFYTDSGGTEDHGVPPDTIRSIVLHRDGRAYAWGSKSRLHYTRVFQHAYWPGAATVAGGLLLNAFEIVINEDDGDVGVALLSEADDLLALKREHVYRLIGDGPAADEGEFGNWRVEQVVTQYGCGAPASAATGPAGTFWVTPAAMVVRVDERTGLPRPIGHKIQPWVRTSVDLERAVGWVHDLWYFLFIPVAGDRWAGHVWCAINGSWWPVTEMDAQGFVTREGGALFWAGVLESDKPSRGIVYQWDGQATDNGTPVTAEMTTRVIDDAVGRWKWWPAIRLAHEGRSGATFLVRAIVNQGSSYVEWTRRLIGPLGSRIVAMLHATKRLQGWALQLYVRSANTLSRPALYGWQRLVHTMNRAPEGAQIFQDVVADPRPDASELTAYLYSTRPFEMLL